MAKQVWDELRKTADELELQIHLASMEARDRWEVLKPQLVELQKTITHEGDRIGKIVVQQVSDLGAALRRLRDDIANAPTP